MVVGYNYPIAFDDYGFNFGPNPYDANAKDPRWKSTLPANLEILRGIGVKVVRWFILGNGFNYGPAPQAYWMPPFGWQWDFDPPDPVHPLFADHFEEMLKIFKKKELQVIPSLVDFFFFGPGPSAGSTAPFGAGGRADVAAIPAKRDVFLNTMIQSLLNVAKGYRDQIFAIEVMNEPIHNLIRPSITAVVGPKDLKQSEMTDFLNAVLQKIRAEMGSDFPTTVGHRLWSDLSTLPTGSKPQFHYYGEPSKFGIVSWDPDPLPSHPGNIFLGELGSMHQGQFSVEHGKPWPELKGADIPADKIVIERLKQLARKDYPLALVWPDLKDYQMANPADNGKDTLKLSPGKIAQVKAFTEGRYPNGVPL
jgi:hypothetical protein